jgi:hypothetical protein
MSEVGESEGGERHAFKWCRSMTLLRGWYCYYCRRRDHTFGAAVRHTPVAVKPYSFILSAACDSRFGWSFSCHNIHHVIICGLVFESQSWSWCYIPNPILQLCLPQSVIDMSFDSASLRTSRLWDPFGIALWARSSNRYVMYNAYWYWYWYWYWYCTATPSRLGSGSSVRPKVHKCTR